MIFKSFKWYLTIQLVVICFIYTFVMRIYAQHVGYQYIEERIDLELSRIIDTNFSYDLNSINSTEILISNKVLNSLLLCSSQDVVVKPSCLQLEEKSKIWNYYEKNNSRFYYTDYLNDGRNWHVLRKQRGQKFDYIGIDKSDLNEILRANWELRDYVHIKIFPLLLVSVSILGFLISSNIIKIINQLKKIIVDTNIDNLSNSFDFKSRFIELQPFVDVFTDLKLRLKKNFDQATRFSSDASHELKTPLAILRGYAERGLKSSADGSEAQLQFTLMAEEIDRLINITEKLLMLARSDAGQLVAQVNRINVSDLIGQLADDAVTFNRNLKISSNIAKNIFWDCDNQLIQQLINNLYSNAAKYNTPNGWIHISLQTTESQLIIEFINSSKNVKSDLSEKAFERFYRGDESHTRKIEGNGLGLSLCKEIALIHKAKLSITVSSNEEVRATFTAPLSNAFAVANI